MTTTPMTLVRIYISEQESLLDKLLTYLRVEGGVTVVTVLRGMENFRSGEQRRTSFVVDLASDTPFILEFCEAPKRAEELIHTLVRRFPLPHVLSWPVSRHQV